MGNRTDLQLIFETALCSRNVYYDPPANITMQYDAIRYSLNDIVPRHADDAKYSMMKRYDGIIISRKPDPDVVLNILSLEYVSFGRHYVADNLHHYPFTIYY